MDKLLAYLRALVGAVVALAQLSGLSQAAQKTFATPEARGDA